MVESMILLRILNGHHVLNVLYYAHCRSVASRVAADGTSLLVTDVMADVTVHHLMLHSAQRLCQLVYIRRLLTQQVQHQSESCFTAYAWQFRELAYGFLQ